MDIVKIVCVIIFANIWLWFSIINNLKLITLSSLRNEWTSSIIIDVIALSVFKYACVDVTKRKNKSHCRITYHIMINRFENWLTPMFFVLKKKEEKRGTEQSTPYTHSIFFSFPSLSPPLPLFLLSSFSSSFLMHFLQAFLSVSLFRLFRKRHFLNVLAVAIYRKTYFINLPSPYVYGTQLIYIDNN